MSTSDSDYDVIIAGTGLYGTTLGSVLARNGVRVLLIERGTHPRFALGEALLPQSAIWPFVIARRFGATDVGHLSHADRIVDHITPTCGLKHSIGFAWQRQGRAAEAQHVHQLIPPHLPFYSESHLYRHDVDMYMLQSARSQGCAYVDETDIVGVDLDPDRVTVRTDGTKWTADIFIDASGKGSRLVDQEGYRRGAPEALTHSRSIFAHVEGLPPIDRWVEADSHGRHLHHGTFHHVFPGGWMWVIPFDNFARSTSRLASVGLMLDPRVYPEDSTLTPQQEFDTIVARFPTMAAQLEGVRVVRPHTRTARLQYSATTSAGHRHLLAPATYGMIDAIYSNGLVHTFESVFRTAHVLLTEFGCMDGAAPGRRDFSAESLRPLDEMHRAQWLDADRMASCAYAAMHHPSTWAAWTQVWLAQVLFSDLWLQRACFRHLSSGDPTELDVLLRGRRPGSASPVSPLREALLDDIASIVHAGPADDTIAARMFERLAAETWLPRHVYDWGNPAERSIDFARQDVAEALLGWGFASSPEPIRSKLFDFSLPVPASA